MKKTFYILLCGLLFAACAGTETSKLKTDEPACSAVFSADSAYRYISDQVAFGARVPGSYAHEQCSFYLTEQLRRFGATVHIQQGSRPNYLGEDQQIVNIIGHYGPTDEPAILLCAHWDCRPWADEEEVYEERYTPVPGANDGASGVGVLLEIARQLGSMEQVPAVDIVFFDVEDMGTPSFYTGKQRENTWCLGSQLWSDYYNRQHAIDENKGVATQEYAYGILLDMVGAPDARFPREYFSTKYAAHFVDKVWKMAEKMGYKNYFVNEGAYPITDDHMYVNTIANIPCIDIIHYDARSGSGFADYWHTKNDNMNNISKITLDAVGKTVLATILD